MNFVNDGHSRDRLAVSVRSSAVISSWEFHEHGKKWPPKWQHSSQRILEIFGPSVVDVLFLYTN